MIRMKCSFILFLPKKTSWKAPIFEIVKAHSHGATSGSMVWQLKVDPTFRTNRKNRRRLVALGTIYFILWHYDLKRKNKSLINRELVLNGDNFSRQMVESLLIYNGLKIVWMIGELQANHALTEVSEIITDFGREPLTDMGLAICRV